MSRNHSHVVIAGGGVAAVETLLALRELAGQQARFTIISPEREFLYRPVTVAEAFERAEARSYPLAEIMDYHGGGELVWDSLGRVEPGEHTVVTSSGKRISYDALVIATGAQTCDPLPGALAFRGRADVLALRSLLDDLVQGSARSVALTLASARMWPLPIYELALMTAAHLREHGASAAKVWLVTPEEEPLELFGPAAARAIKPMLDARGILLRTSSLPALVRDRALVLVGGGEVYVDRVITLPLLDGPMVPGVPHDQHGFIPVDAHGCVAGLDDVYAAGDVTAFPLKQGGLAAQQADAVAETIAAELGIPITPKPFHPVLRGLLMTGGAPLYLRAEPQRLPREATVAIEATPLRRTTRDASAAAGQPLWWPPGEGRRTLHGAVPRHRPPRGAHRRATQRQSRRSWPTSIRGRVRGRTRARAAARRLRRALGRLQLGAERARRSRSASRSTAARVRGQAPRMARRRTRRVEARSSHGAAPR
jgi:sulfide:quinone oxidoreductase